MSDTGATTSEPAVPVVAPVPIKSLKALLTQAEQDWPQATQPGASVAFRVDQQGVAVVGTLTLHDDVTLRVLGSRTFDGHWQVGGQVRWTPRQ